MRVAKAGAGRGLVEVEGLLDEYLEYLRRYRNLVDTSIGSHRHYAKCFLDHFRRGEWIWLSNVLNVESIQTYAAGYAKRHGRGSSHMMFSTLRVLLHYLHLEGYLLNDLSEAVPTVLRRQLSHVPRGISEEHIVRLLRSIDTSEAVGKRDYAMLQILSNYGVRGVHVRKLKLDDVQWAANRIVFRPAKGGKRIVQHLTSAVGNSLLDYLRHSRPRITPYREVFLRCNGTPRPLGQPSNLSAVVRRRLKAAGIELPDGVSRGSHSFRHAFASRMVCGAQPFKHVADMLGHKILNSTMIYTKIDLPAMRQAVLEWPEVSS